MYSVLVFLRVFFFFFLVNYLPTDVQEKEWEYEEKMFTGLIVLHYKVWTLISFSRGEAKEGTSNQILMF